MIVSKSVLTSQKCVSAPLFYTFCQLKTSANSYRAHHVVSSRTITLMSRNLIVTGTMHRFFQSPPQTGLKKIRKMGLNTNSSQFTLDGKPFCILGGSVHYFRVPRPYWRDRLMKMMACGINTLTT